MLTSPTEAGSYRPEGPRTKSYELPTEAQRASAVSKAPNKSTRYQWPGTFDSTESFYGRERQSRSAPIVTSAAFMIAGM